MQNKENVMPNVGEQFYQGLRWFFFTLSYFVLIINMWSTSITYPQLLFTVAMYVISITLTLVEFDRQHINSLQLDKARHFRWLVNLSEVYSVGLIVLMIIGYKSGQDLTSHPIVYTVVKVIAMVFTTPVFFANLWRLTLQDDSDDNTQSGLESVEKYADQDLETVLRNNELDKFNASEVKTKAYRDFIREKSHAKSKRNKKR